MDSTLGHESVANVPDITRRTPLAERPNPAVGDLLDQIATSAMTAHPAGPDGK